MIPKISLIGQEELHLERPPLEDYGIQYSNQPPHFVSENLTMTFERETSFKCNPEAIEIVKRLARGSDS